MTQGPVAVDQAAEPHPAAQALLDRLDASPSLDEQPLQEVRRATRERVADPADREPVGHVEDVFLREHGHSLPVRVYAPEGEGPFPVLVWAHGGRFVLGDVESEDATARALTNETGCLVCSVDYRLAPEHPFPAPFEDVVSAVTWAADGAADHGGDTGRVLVGGQSAGATLAAASALYARDRGGPALAGQVLVVPVVSYSHDVEGGPGPERDLEYLSDPLHGYNPYAFPLEAAGFADLPPATVVTAGFDPLRHQGRAYAERLHAAGVPVRHHHLPDSVHLFFTRFGEEEWSQSREAARTIGEDVRTALDG